MIKKFLLGMATVIGLLFVGYICLVFCSSKLPNNIENMQRNRYVVVLKNSTESSVDIKVHMGDEKRQIRSVTDVVKNEYIKVLIDTSDSELIGSPPHNIYITIDGVRFYCAGYFEEGLGGFDVVDIYGTENDNINYKHIKTSSKEYKELRRRDKKYPDEIRWF